MKPRAVQPSSIGSSSGPLPRIWKKWSMTQIESKPTSSAVRTIRARVGPDRGGAAGPGERADLETDLHGPRVRRRSVPCRGASARWAPASAARAQRKRSIASGMSVSRDGPLAAGRSPAPDQRRRPTGGLAQASSAAEAISSATARTVERITRPSASGVPRRSSRGRSPDAPIATSTIPQRHGRPNESETTTARSTARRSRTAPGSGRPRRPGRPAGG